MQEIFTTADLAHLLDTDPWRIRRLFEDGTLPEPDRLGRQRAIPKSLIPSLVEALSKRGWLSSESEVVVP